MSFARSLDLTGRICRALNVDAGGAGDVVFTHAGDLPAAFPAADLASAAVASAALSVTELICGVHGTRPGLHVDRRACSMWFDASLRPIGWSVPGRWDPIAGDYPTRDGWIRLHTNAPHHRAAAQRIVGSHADKQAMARAVAQWTKSELEQAIVDAGGAAAEMRSIEQWQQHPQGRAIAAEPLAHIVATEAGPAPNWLLPAARPLAGLRVLDLTRVLAGPVATRFLAGYGANVLRIDPPVWDEGGNIPEVVLGKRCARLDLREKGDRGIFAELLSQADIFVHGYRPGALDGLGFDAAARRALSPGLVDICLDAYGWSGPWATRRGFDSLVQMSAGIADRGMQRRQADKPVPLPFQALDHATGYLMAAAAVHGVARRSRQGLGTQARFSLARTAKLLIDQVDQVEERADSAAEIETGSAPPFAAETEADWSATIEATAWGEARRLLPPVEIAGTPMRWDRPAGRLGSAAPRWLGAENE